MKTGSTVAGSGRAGEAAIIPSLQRCLLTGSLGFCLVSVGVFSTVAFAERWMYSHLGVLGAYVVWTLLFIVSGGAVFRSLVTGAGLRFYPLFGLAFFAYAAGWMAAYFILRGAAGEWAGSLIGSVLMGVIIAAGFGVVRRALPLVGVLFIANSAGYFLGAALNEAIRGKTGMLLWGAVYGLCLGAGLGAVLHFAQSFRAAAASKG